ncbi:MAG: hypothetical protein ACP5P2_01415 [Candidatus Micrarchaeia archaeon]|jgi:hypothetical protein
MRIIRKNNIILVLTHAGQDENSCPVLNIKEKKAKIRDDYHGAIKFSKKMVGALGKL